MLYDIRVAAGDPNGKLMQDELVERIRAKFAEPPVQPQAVRLSDNYVQEVPDKCDRIVWRGHYYYLKQSPHGAIEAELLASTKGEC